MYKHYNYGNSDDGCFSQLIMVCVAIVLGLVLFAWGYMPNCVDSAEGRAECSEYLGSNFDMEYFEEIVSTCGAYSRSQITNIRMRCVYSYFPNIDYSVIERCYVDSSRRGLLETVQCIQKEQ